MENMMIFRYGKKIEIMESVEDNEQGVIYANWIPGQIDTTSKIYQIGERINKLDDNELSIVYQDLMMTIYHRTHKHCPICGSENVYRTIIGFMPEMIGDTLKERIKSFKYKDKNIVKCDCGWTGIIDKLK